MISFLSVLDTQRSLFATQTELIRSRQQALVELVNLYESLGGGWPADATGEES
jgi:multidrug efflux system outer membrane protein